MLLKCCVISLILSFGHFLVIDAQESKEDNTGTNATNDVTTKSTTNVAKLMQKENITFTNDLDKSTINSPKIPVGEQMQDKNITFTNDLDKAIVNSPTTRVSEQMNEENITISNDLNDDTKKSSKTTVVRQFSKKDATVTDAIPTINNKEEKIMLKMPKKKQIEKIKLQEIRQTMRYNVTTKDGYILTIFRLPQQSDGDTKRHAVLLAPGLYQSSDRFLLRKPKQNLANKLQDDGYDVWIFNARGNKYSRNHNRLNPDDKLEGKEFFDYTYFEIGYYDLSATVDYILDTTGLETIDYIGHSLGGTFFLVLNSMLPEYNGKFGRATLMAPFSYQAHFSNKNILALLGDVGKFYTELINAEVFEVFPDLKKDKFTLDECFGITKHAQLCRVLELDHIMDLDGFNFMKTETRGGSIKTLAHWAQNIQNKKFSPWESETDTKHSDIYDAKDPAEYNLDKITVPTEIIFSRSDEYVDENDIILLVNMMGNATSRKVTRQNFNHDDFITGRQVMYDVYDDIIKKLPDPIITTTTTTTSTTPKSTTNREAEERKKSKANGSLNILPGLAILIIGLKCQVLMHLHNKMA